MSGHDYFFEGTHLYKGKYPRKDEELDALAEVGENVGKGGDGRRSDEVKLVQREQNLRCLSFLEIFIPGSNPFGTYQVEGRLRPEQKEVVRTQPKLLRMGKTYFKSRCLFLVL